MNGKYRVWQKKEKRWLDYQVLLQSGRVGEIAEDGSVVCHKDTDVAVCFSTNLHDKNSKKIYEGDVVSWMNSSGETWRYAVKFEDGAFMVGPYYLNARSPEYRVIGNIYENPELISSKQ